MTDRSKYVYESRDRRSDRTLPSNVETFLVEIFRELQRFNPSDKKLKTDGSEQLDVLEQGDDEDNSTPIVKFPRN